MLFYKATKLSDLAKTNAPTCVSEAFRSPASFTTAKDDGIRLSIDSSKDLFVRNLQPTGWGAVWSWLFPSATVVELSGRLNVTLKVFPSHVQIRKRRWFSKSSVLARFEIAIPVFEEIGDEPSHQIIVRSALAFLYPFVPMHVEVAVNDQVVFAQGKFASG